MVINRYCQHRPRALMVELGGAAFLLGVLIGVTAPARAMEPKWPQGEYRYLVIEQDIKDVLTELGRNINIPVEVSSQIKGKLRGRPPGKTANEFLNNLCDSYGLIWYYDGAVIHVSTKSEVRTELINIGRLPVADLNEELSKLGIADPRFTVHHVPGSDVVSVSGPAAFIAQVRRALTALTDTTGASGRAHEEKFEDEGRVRVFRGNRSQILDLRSAPV